MKLIKINTDHYVIVDDSEKMTHSTSVFDEHNLDLQNISLQEVKELIGEVDVEKKAINSWEGCDGCDTNDELFFTNGYQRGYNQALEDNKEKKYTEEDLKYMFECGRNYQNNAEITFKVSMEYIHPKTEWEVEFIDGKLKIK